MDHLKQVFKLHVHHRLPLMASLLLLVMFMGFIPVGETLWAVNLFGQGEVTTQDGGTSIEVTKTAHGFWTLKVKKTVEKKAEPRQAEQGVEADPLKTEEGDGQGGSAAGGDQSQDGSSPDRQSEDFQKIEGVDPSRAMQASGETSSPGRRGNGVDPKSGSGAGGDPPDRARGRNISIFGVRGEICIRNTGEHPTEDLTIFDQVEVKLAGESNFTPLENASWAYKPPQLEPGEEACYSYEIVFDHKPGTKAYRNVVHVTITNHVGHMGEPFGPEAKADFCIPGDPTEIIVLTTVIESRSSNRDSMPSAEEELAGTGTPGTAPVESEGGLEPSATPTIPLPEPPDAQSPLGESQETPTPTPTTGSSPTPAASPQPPTPQQPTPTASSNPT